ncbi:MAG: hypothetical protein K2J20_04805, partial [Bacilli bacterium]|nr:hypothetical protein [Bacilli bacterium]
MKYDDLEKTKDLFDIVDVPSPIENIEMEGASKGSVSGEEDLFGLMEDTPNDVKKTEKDDKKKKKDKDKGLSKKKKIAIIVSVVVVLVIAITVVVYFLLKGNEDVEEPAKPEEPTVIVEKDNYIYKNGVLTFLDEREKEIGTYECENKDEKLCFVVDYSDEDKFDGEKNYYEDGTLIPRRSAIYLDKYVFIYDNAEASDGTINLYNIEEAKSEDSYLLVKGFADSNYVILQDTNKKYGAIEIGLSGITKKIEFKFDYLGRMNKDSKVVAKTNNKYFIYSLDGKNESKGIAQEIKSYNNNYIVAYNDGYYIYDYKSKLVMEDSFDYVSLLDKYVALVKDNKLYIRDYENNKYNEDGIEISGEDYNVRYIYNEDKVLQKTDRVFDLAIDS